MLSYLSKCFEPFRMSWALGKLFERSEEAENSKTLKSGSANARELLRGAADERRDSLAPGGPIPRLGPLREECSRNGGENFPCCKPLKNPETEK
jgi:hypothetical protein